MLDRHVGTLASLALALPFAWALACGESAPSETADDPVERREPDRAEPDRAASRRAEPGPAEPGPAEPRSAEPRSADQGAPSDPSAPDPLLDALGDPGADDPAGVTAALDDQGGAMPGPLADRAPPPRGCALQSDAAIRVLADAGPPAILADRDGFVVAAYDAQGVRIVRVTPGALPVPIGSLALDPPPARSSAAGAPPALARTGDREATLVAIDGRGRVLEATFDPTLPAVAPSPRLVSESGADARFPAAVRAVGTRRVIAWTDGSATPMRLRLAILDGRQVVSTHDVTPIAGGGAAPIFLEGATPPTLLFLDPRVGISVVHRVVLGADGAPGTTEVQRPVNLAAAPPAIAAARVSGRTWLAYAAVGNGATRAVGLVDAAATDPPSAIVPGVGYGEALALDAVPAARSVVFAAEAPSAAPADAPHEIRLRRVDDRGAGDPLVLPAPATDPTLARREDGLLAIAHRAGTAVVVQLARCDD